MTMSRKHYREAASVLNALLLDDSMATDPDVVAQANFTVRRAAEGLADMFKADNRAFDRQKFMDAVNGE